MQNIRRARKDESKLLSNIAFNSEAYWGYDYDYMDKFKFIYCISEEFIENNPTVVIEENGDAVGFYGILLCEQEISLEYFFIEPKYIGKGYGKLLWNYLVKDCLNLNINEFSIVTSPQAKDFYIKMGAIHCGDVESSLKKGRIIPKLVYSVEKKSK